MQTARLVEHEVKVGKRLGRHRAAQRPVDHRGRGALRRTQPAAIHGLQLRQGRFRSRQAGRTRGGRVGRELRVQQRLLGSGQVLAVGRLHRVGAHPLDGDALGPGIEVGGGLRAGSGLAPSHQRGEQSSQRKSQQNTAKRRLVGHRHWGV